jgi:hypothetical protein
MRISLSADRPALGPQSHCIGILWWDIAGGGRAAIPGGASRMFMNQKLKSVETPQPQRWSNSTEHVDELSHGRVLEVDLHGKLAREDYERFVPEIERMIREYFKIRVLITMHDFHGWDAGAIMEDIKWNARHFSDIERLAVVGEKTWHTLMTRFSRPFSKTEVRYFTAEELDAARAWINE